MPYFFCRLNPPRPTFAFDMSEAEKAVMEQHAEKLRVLAAAGVLVVAGPVADPAGPWGLGVFQAESAEAMRALADEDPAIKAAAGFSYDIYPMLSAVLGRPNS